MSVIKAYSGTSSNGSVLKNLIRTALFTLILSFVQLPEALSQDLPEYDEIAVFLEIPGVGGAEIDALIRGEEVFLPVKELFDFLKIRNLLSSDLETISGFFVNQEATYEINYKETSITCQGRRFEPEKGDLIKTESNLYLKSSWFGQVFGLDCVFNFRSLSVTVTSKLELPVIREMRQEEMRRNLSRLKGEIRADTNIGRTYPLFRFGMADWSVISTQELNGRSDTRLNLALGSMIAGGEATASLYYDSSNPFNEKQQYYLWRFVNNDFAPLRQVLAGKIHTGAIASIYNPVLGVQLTNTPTTFRRSFGTYTVSDKTEPGWIVELYINNILVDYVKADASGFFTFEVPLVYGNSLVKLKFFGPWGEERTREHNINIPYNFLPAKTFEYTLSAGIVEDTLNSRFSRAAVNYGVARSITIGTGAEYLSSITSQPFMPFLNASLRLTSNLLVSGEFAPGVRTKGTLSYRLPSNMQLDLNYTFYEKDQKAILFNYREERKATLSMPLRIGKLSAFQRFSVNQIVLPALNKYTTGEWMISASLFGVNTNLSTYALIIDEVKPYFYSNLSVALRLPAGFILMPQAQYSYSEGKLFSGKLRIEKSLLEHAFVNLSYEQNFRNNMKLAELGFRYDFSFAQAGASVRQYDSKTSFTEYARGSIINDRKTRYLGTDNRFNVGRGGISVVPFLDLDNNGKRGPGEPKAFGLNLRAGSGRVEKSDRDTTIRILGLEPYTNCFIELDPNSFDNISWRLPRQTYSIAVDPDILKFVEIPVSIAGEANGYITLQREGVSTGIGRVTVLFSSEGPKPAGKVLTEADGYYSYFGLQPGRYTVRIDSSQLHKLGMTSEPEFREFSIRGGIEGDIVSGLDFVLKVKPADTTKLRPATPEIPGQVRKDTTYMILHEVTEEVYTITEDSWAIQIGAFRDRALAEGFRDRLEKELGKDVQITIAGDFYRVRILDLPTRAEVDENVVKLNKLGFKELWIIRLVAKERQILLITREDSLARIKELPPAFGRDSLSRAVTATIQLGAFRFRANAVNFLKTLEPALGEKVRMIYEDGYYKIRIPDISLVDQTLLEAIEKLKPSLGRLDLKNIWIMPFRTAIPAEEPAERLHETIPKAFVQPDASITVAERKPAELVLERKAQIAEPSVALQVAIFHKESQALRAQRRIMTKLNLPVEIVRQFDYYHVIVTGFYTREETYQYYPELAGIGYPGVTLILDYKRPK